MKLLIINLFLESIGDYLIFYGSIERIIIRKNGNILQKILNAIGKSLSTKILQFDIPDNVIINFDNLLEWKNCVDILVFSTISNFIEFNNLMSLIKNVRKINCFAIFNIKMSEMWDFIYDNVSFSNYLEMIEFVKQKFIDLKTKNPNVRLNLTFEY